MRSPPARAAHGSDPSIRAGPRYQLALWAAGAGEKEPPVCAASERRANHISERRSEQPACPSCAAFPKLEASTTPPSTPLYLSSRSIFLAPLLTMPRSSSITANDLKNLPLLAELFKDWGGHRARPFFQLNVKSPPVGGLLIVRRPTIAVAPTPE